MSLYTRYLKTPADFASIAPCRYGVGLPAIDLSAARRVLNGDEAFNGIEVRFSVTPTGWDTGAGSQPGTNRYTLTGTSAHALHLTYDEGPVTDSRQFLMQSGHAKGTTPPRLKGQETIESRSAYHEQTYHYDGDSDSYVADPPVARDQDCASGYSATSGTRTHLGFCVSRDRKAHLDFLAEFSGLLNIDAQAIATSVQLYLYTRPALMDPADYYAMIPKPLGYDDAPDSFILLPETQVGNLFGAPLYRRGWIPNVPITDSNGNDVRFTCDVAVSAQEV